MNGRSHRTDGFTLVEVVVALTLVALIMLGLVTALGTFANTGARLERRALESDDVRLAHAFLRESLAAASPRYRVREHDSAQSVWFVGGPVQIEWLGLMPARHGVGGLYHLRLAFDAGYQRGRLVLQYVPYTGDDFPPSWPDAPTHLVLDAVDDFEVLYQRLGSQEWRQVWDDSHVLPGRVRVRVARDGGAWPDLVVPVTAAEPGVDVNESQPLGSARPPA